MCECMHPGLFVVISLFHSRPPTRYQEKMTGIKGAYLINAIPASTLDSVVSFPPPLDLVKRRLGIDGLLVQDVETANIVGLACLELIRGVFPQHIIQFKGHSLASIMTARLCRAAGGGDSSSSIGGRC